MWDLPRPGLEPVSPALAGRLSTTAPPGKPHDELLNQGLLSELGGQWSFKWSEILPTVQIILSSYPSGIATPYLNSQQMTRPPAETFLSLLVVTSTADTTQLSVFTDMGAQALPCTEKKLSPGTFIFPFSLIENPELSHFLLDPDENLTWTSDSETILSLCSFVIQYKPSKLPANFWRKRCPYLPSMYFAPVKALWSPGGGTKPLPDQVTPCEQYPGTIRSPTDGYR